MRGVWLIFLKRKYHYNTYFLKEVKRDEEAIQ